MTTFHDNAVRQRYELDTPEGITFAEYRDVAHARVLTHFESPEAARGKGYAAQLMAEIVLEARAAGRKLRAACPYAVAYFARHPKDVADVSVD
jgi:predicted GNAT family acetyltransferase